MNASFEATLEVKGIDSIGVLTEYDHENDFRGFQREHHALADRGERRRVRR